MVFYVFKIILDHLTMFGNDCGCFFHWFIILAIPCITISSPVNQNLIKAQLYVLNISFSVFLK